jgi:hypothetical protein
MLCAATTREPGRSIDQELRVSPNADYDGYVIDPVSDKGHQRQTS